MSIRERLEDARLLWEGGRKHGAWIHVLIAAAATSRLRFPTDGDGAAFRKLIRELAPSIVMSGAPPIVGGIGIVFNGGGPNQMTLEDVMYKHLRCNLLHEAVMPAAVTLSESREEDGRLVAELKGGSPLTIPDFWVLNLAKAIAIAPENSSDCSDLFPEVVRPL